MKVKVRKSRVQIRFQKGCGLIWKLSATMQEECRAGENGKRLVVTHILVDLLDNPLESGHNTDVYGGR